MKLNAVMAMIFRSGYHVVKVTDGEVAQLLFEEDWNCGDCVFDYEARVRSILDDETCSLVEVRIW